MRVLARFLVSSLIALTILFDVRPASAQTCQTTASSRHVLFVPPAPYAALPPKGFFNYGTPKLWVALDESGRWLGLFDPKRNLYRNKLPLNREGFDFRREPTPPVTVTATRVDQRASAVKAESAHGVFSEGVGSFVMTALDLPVGCWQITAQYATEPPLTFVIAVP